MVLSVSWFLVPNHNEIIQIRQTLMNDLLLDTIYLKVLMAKEGIVYIIGFL